MPNPSILPNNVITPWSSESVGNMLVMVAGGVGNPASTAHPTGSYVVYVPFYLNNPFIVNSVFWHNGATVAGNIDVGVYDIGKRRLFSTGAQLQSGTNVLQLTQITPTTLGAGLFFLGLCMSNVTGTMFAQTFISGNSGTPLIASAGVYNEYLQSTLPASGTFSVPTRDFMPIFGISNKAIV